MRSFLISVATPVLVAITLGSLGVGCGGPKPLPVRGVVEGDVGGWHFRRFQPVLDLEVWVEDNPAQAYTASYVTDRAEKRGKIEDADVVNVFVTRYHHEAGIARETVKFVRRLGAERGYQIEEHKIGGVRAVTINGHGESWVMWAAKRHVVKIGGRSRADVPGSVVKAYGERYPSVMQGGMLEGPLPPEGPAPAQKPGDPAAPVPYDEDNPTPDWDKAKGATR